MRLTAPAQTTYRPGDFLLTGPQGALLGRGERAVVESLADLPEALRAHGAGTVVVGAIPFLPGRPARLVVPERLTAPTPVAARAVAPVRATVAAEPSGDCYLTAVGRAVERLRAPGGVAKVVLARTLLATAEEPFDIPAALAALAARDPGGNTFAVETGDGTLIGATPELLVSRRGLRVLANPLAGSARRDADAVADGRAAAALLRSPKDRAEHRFVVEDIAERLRPFVRDLRVPDVPELLSTRAMWHLSTRVSGTLVDPAITSVDLATALHPTPAVCGTPTDLARAAIGELEPVDRGFYTGMVGWTDATGDGAWVIALRCGLIQGATARLYAGAGVVADSDPAAELAETTAKFGTLLTALGLGTGR
ncbi:isochorismate synthase [Actinokineospora pegani]|uniref:isochorismate synthase n=1 Tax=Actinokineospora pegani TaxID=2654637 RepID=UPI0012EA0FBE|nr:isochorismate synthase [Actinokineospora pegani]